MKSPNAKLSLDHLAFAIKLVTHALEDLKNDPKVREMQIHDNLRDCRDGIERELLILVGDLRYPNPYPQPKKAVKK